MSRLKRGTVRRYSRVKYGTMWNDQLTNQAATRVGKQAKTGPIKGMTPPGLHAHKIDRSGG